MISDTDLIIKGDNIYHINVNKDNVAETIILVGDQDRVPLISKYFDKITHKSQHREFVVHTGFYQGKYLSVISTGIGTDNIDIVVNELDAIFNVDLKTRQIKENLTSLNLIRLGTCGTIREEIPVDSIIVSDYAMGFDNLLSFYKDGYKFYQNTMHCSTAFNGYIVECSEELRNLFPNQLHGITATFPGFYAPQGRNLRIDPDPISSGTLINNLLKMEYNKVKVLNFEMETSALYGLAKLSGHKALTLCNVVANRATKEFTKDAETAVNNMIQIFLETIKNIK